MSVSHFHFPFLRQLYHLKRSLLKLLFCMLASFFFLLLFLLSFNGFTLFPIHLPSLSSPPPKTLLPSPPPPISKWSILMWRSAKMHNLGITNVLQYAHSSMFHARVQAFFAGNSSSFSGSSCKVRFFMTLKAFGDRELLSVESLFMSHPQACLMIVSKSLDSDRGTQILRPFSNNGFRVMAIAPDFNYLFKDTHAEAWFDRLKRGNVNPGAVSLGQNLSNLLRLALLYKYGGIYIDIDVIVLKSFSMLRNSIGAQTFDVKTGKWSRLNNTVLIFDKGHPLLWKFIKEFALTFDGNSGVLSLLSLKSCIYGEWNTKVLFHYYYATLCILSCALE